MKFLVAFQGRQNNVSDTVFMLQTFKMTLAYCNYIGYLKFIFNLFPKFRCYSYKIKFIFHQREKFN